MENALIFFLFMSVRSNQRNKDVCEVALVRLVAVRNSIGAQSSTSNA
jgi:hypothetical protein